MELNIIFAITAVVVVLAAIVLTYRFGPTKRPFIFDLLEAVGEPTRRPILVGNGASRRRSDRGSPKISSHIHEGAAYW